MPNFTIPIHEHGTPGQKNYPHPMGTDHEVVDWPGGFDVRLPTGAYLNLMIRDIDPQTPDGYVSVAGIYVPEKQQRQGVGRRLAQLALVAAKQRGYKGIGSDPAMRSPAANALWRALTRERVVKKIGRYDVLVERDI